MKRFLLAAFLTLAAAQAARAADTNLKVVTDGSPDHSDMASLIHSITSAWPAPKEKCWAVWYWNHIGRRQTNPMKLHGVALTDPIRQFNDYGFAMCSTVAGVNCGIFANMGLKVKYWDISLHTVPEVEYDGRWHMYDDSLSALYTLCDGVTIAGVEDIGKSLGCPASGGKVEPGHIGRYHCLTGTSANGFLTGADTPRSLEDEGKKVFNPKGLKFRSYFNEWDWGHRYILNLRENETYTRYYHRLDAAAARAAGEGEGGGKGKKGFASDPAYYVPSEGSGKDPESFNPRYRIRGNGVWTLRPALSAEQWRKSVHEARGIAAAAPAGLQPERAGAPGEAIFRVQSANVTTSQKIKAAFLRQSAGDRVALSVSTTNGLKWREIWKAETTGEVAADLQLIEEVNGAYETLLKVELAGQAAAGDAVLKSLEIETITALNAKTQPQLRLGKNTVYVGAGEPTDSIVLWPALEGEKYKERIVEERNVVSDAEHKEYLGVLHPAANNEDAWIVYRIDAPGDIARLSYGGRFYNRTADGVKGYIKLLHSTDGKTWTQSWSLDNNEKPWDVIHYETVAVPKGTRAVYVKYLMRTPNINETGAGCGIYSVRMEANFAPVDPAFKPLEVTYQWNEIQKDRSRVERGHTQRVERVPFTYTINVGGEDHPVMESLRIGSSAGILPASMAGSGPAGPAQYGYSDGKDAGGGKFVDRWVTVGRNLAEGKKYTLSEPSKTNWGAGDPEGTKLTDGVVGANYAGGATVRYTALWDKGQKPDITVDLEKAETCGAFRVHLGAGYPWWDALRGEVKDTVELLTSVDGREFKSQGFFNFDLRRKDIPINYMLTDDETAGAFNFELIPPTPVAARYVRWRLTPARMVTISEVQVLDSIKYEPFDIKIALPK